MTQSHFIATAADEIFEQRDSLSSLMMSQNKGMTKVLTRKTKDKLEILSQIPSAHRCRLAEEAKSQSVFISTIM